MPVLQQQDLRVIQRRIDTELKRDVSLTLYTKPAGGLFVPGRECTSCGPTQQLIEEVSGLSRRIQLEVVDFYANQQEAAKDGVSRIPALTIGARGDGGARFFGMPSGLQFVVLLESIIRASHKRTSLDLETKRQLKRLKKDVHIQLFVTASCQYSPAMAGMAHAMAMESPRVAADVVQVQEFRDLGTRYGVRAVPRTVINDAVQLTGAVPEATFLRRILQAVGVGEAPDDDVESISDQTTPI